MRTFLIAVLIVAGITQTPSQFRAPVPGATCFENYVALGTSNLPAGGGRQTTVVNMTAFVIGSPLPQVVAWVDRTLDGHDWLQVAVVRRQAVAQALAGAHLPDLAAKVRGLHALSSASGAVVIAPHKLRAVTRALRRLGARNWACFARDLPAKYVVNGAI